MQHKTAIVILSDPRSPGEESLGRLLNALAAAYDFKHAGEPVTVLFQGAGTRWSEPLTHPDHPAHGLYNQVRDAVAGVSAACSEVFGATADANAAGLPLVSGNAVPGTAGLPSLRALMQDGYQILTF